MPQPFIQTPVLPTNAQSQKWYNLPGITAALAVYSAINAQRCFALIITKDSNENEEWYEALKFITKGSLEDNAQHDSRGFQLFRFPDNEILPYDHFSPHPDISSDRLQTLYQLQRQTCGICLVSANTLLARLCPPEHVNHNSLQIAVGDRINIREFTHHLTSIGYQHRESVFEHGEFAVRGALLDLFPMGSDSPYRIELFDNDVESLRNFDPETQRSLARMNAISILPAGEVSLDKNAINLFRDHWHQEFTHNPDICPVYQDTLAGVSSAGIESYLPMFYSQTASLFDYLPENCIVIRTETFKNDIEHFIADIAERYNQNSIDPTRPLLKPEKLYLSVDECFGNMKLKGQIILSPNDCESPVQEQRGEYRFASLKNPPLLIDEHSDNPTKKIEEFNSKADSGQTRNHALYCLSSSGRREVFIDKLKAVGIDALATDSWLDFYNITHNTDNKKPRVGVAIARFNHGATFITRQHGQATHYSLITEPELFGVALKPKARSERSKAAIAEASIHSLMELQLGSPVVHVDHGVGRYLGLERMTVPISPRENIEAEFLVLSYAGNDKLYVPVTALHCISRYMGGDESTAPLNKLGSESWANAKNKAINNVHDVAAELLAIYAKRQSMNGMAHTLNEAEYNSFAEQFPFEPTADQQIAIDAVLSDMQNEQPMDRLICGDVGFGKTEVAMRAAFVAVSNNTQVMLLVPTTLLAQQHLQNFQDRFSDWPLRIDVLSRFRTASEQSRLLEDFNDGKIDILIGTHKLLQKDIKAAQLGLVIIDEEHRFGVRQKEQLKRLCANVDLLTMTATPIPRTLNMAMSGLRDLSIITTPPARRLSVKTFVREKQNSVVKEAMLRELLRGGQIFYLHNDVKTIDKTASELRELVPDARIAIGHGQMPERDLERVMADFYHKKFSVLLCTTIIETGIDIPNANTIIIDRADKFGLAQLHQLRGRVGRSHHQAYAYLFTPNKKSLTKDAEKRLTAIAEAQDLGAGFMLATHDLEIRGAGELLGDEQSGQIHSLGYSLYLDMLEKAVSALKAGEDIDLSKPLQPTGEINLHLPALIPDDYLPDIHIRLTLYKRIANADTNSALRELKVEMIDRFGLLNNPVNNLFAVTEIKLRCTTLGIQKIDAGHSGGYLEFTGNTSIDPMKIVSLVQSAPETYQLKSATRLSFSTHSDTAEQRIAMVNKLLDTLAR